MPVSVFFGKGEEERLEVAHACTIRMSGLVVQQKADDERERAEQTQEMLAAHKQAVLAGESFEHENLHETFSENFALFAAESESRNVDAKEHAMAVRDEIQEIVDQFRDRDRPCNICVFGLMGHGKSRFINLMLTALSKEPSAEAGAGGETVVAVDEVPSGDGSTTRSYTRYMMPITGSNGRFMFHVVDTIGVKFADEFRPSRQEMEQEFALVRSQLRGLDFRHRVGVIARTIPGAGPAKSAVVKGEDVMTITPEVPNAYNLAYLSDQLREKSGGWLWVPGITPSLTESQVGAAFKASGEGTATVTLRGGHTLRGVPWSFLADPDGTNWSLDPAGVYRDKRGFGQRLRHTMAAWRCFPLLSPLPLLLYLLLCDRRLPVNAAVLAPSVAQRCREYRPTELLILAAKIDDRAGVDGRRKAQPCNLSQQRN